MATVKTYNEALDTWLNQMEVSGALYDTYTAAQKKNDSPTVISKLRVIWLREQRKQAKLYATVEALRPLIKP